MKACAMNRCHLLAALLLLAASQAIAVPTSNYPGRFKVNPLHLESGPSRGLVHAVRRDAMGYLWVCTDNGLMRYDGYEYTVFNNNPNDPRSLGANLVLSLLIDSEQTLWVGNHMISAFNPNTETFDNYPVTDGAAVWGMAEGPGNILWVSAARVGLIGFDMRRREVVYHTLNKPMGNAHEIPEGISEIINDRANPAILWMTAETGLFRFDTRSYEIQRFFSIEELGQAQLSATSGLKLDRDGRIWMVSE
jgi:ligand-binding sensor domain-containing protein